MKLDPKLQAQLGEMFKPVEALSASPDSEDAPQLLMVEVESLQTVPQPRTQFDAGELRNLQRSIEDLARAGRGIGGSGILQPLLARVLPDDVLLLVAGERRLRAAKAAGIARVPVVVGEALSDEDAFGQAIVENLLRADLSPLEEARALQQWMTTAKLSLRDAAKKLGRDKGYLENRLRLLSMGEDVQEMVSSRKDTLPHARLIDAVADEQQRRQLIEMVVSEGAGKREIETLIAEFKRESDSSVAGNQANQGQKNHRITAFHLPLQEAWQSLQKSSKGLEGVEAIRLAEKLEKLAARLRKAASSS